MGHTIVQADSRQPLTTEASPRSQASPCEIYGDQALSEGFQVLTEGFLHVLRLSVVTVILSVLHNEWFICYWRNTGLAIDAVAKQHIKIVLFL
jgi:hypothetical protein